MNDRSFLGDRDSELAAIVKDTEETVVPMNGLPYAVGVTVHEMRVRLMAEHLGLPEDHPSLTDPIRAASFWRETAMANTVLFEAAFPHIASNKLATWEAYTRGLGHASKTPAHLKSPRSGRSPKSAPSTLGHHVKTTPLTHSGSHSVCAEARGEATERNVLRVSADGPAPAPAERKKDDRLPGVQGFVQLFPLRFLSEEPLSMRDTVLGEDVFA